MSLITLKRWDNRYEIFSYECKNNSVKKTLEKAVKKGIDLSYLKLDKSNLEDAKLNDAIFKYKTGEYVVSKSFDGRYWKECAPGIHFFINREDACNFLIS